MTDLTMRLVARFGYWAAFKLIVMPLLVLGLLAGAALNGDAPPRPLTRMDIPAHPHSTEVQP